MNLRFSVFIFALSLLAALHFYTASVNAQTPPAKGYRIGLKIPPLAGKKFTFGYFFQGDFVPVNTLVLNAQGAGAFASSEAVPDGVYLVTADDRSFVTEVMLDNNAHFDINVSITPAGAWQVKFVHSPQSNTFFNYQRMVDGQNAQEKSLNASLKKALGRADSAKVEAKLAALDTKRIAWEDSIVKLMPDSFVSTYFLGLREPVVPDSLAHPKNVEERAVAQYYYKSHYWDGVNFWDGRMVTTPYFSPKLDKYFKEVLDSKPDSLIKELDKMLSLTVANDGINAVVLSKALFGSMNHTLPWDDVVFLHLFENYIENKQQYWLTEEDRAEVTKTAYYLMKTMVGSPSPRIDLVGLDGKMATQYEMDAKYTVLAFWDPECSHCKETLPRLDSMYVNAWKAAGVKIFAVALEGDAGQKEWNAYITQHHLEDWKHVYQSKLVAKMQEKQGKKACQQEFDLWYMPTFFLLDSEKHYMARRCTFDNLKDILTTVLK